MAKDSGNIKKKKVKARTEEILVKIGNLSKVQRLLICLLTFILIGGAYYYFIDNPRSKNLANAKQDLKKQRQTLEKFKQQAKALPVWEKKMATVEGEFNEAMKALPDKRELPALLTSISKVGKAAGLSFQLFQPEPEIKKEFFKEIPLSMKVVGGYHQIADFFFQVANMNRVVNIRSVKMKTENDSDKLTMDCSAVTYMFVEPSKNETKTKGRKKNRKKRG